MINLGLCQKELTGKQIKVIENGRWQTPGVKVTREHSQLIIFEFNFQCLVLVIDLEYNHENPKRNISAETTTDVH